MNTITLHIMQDTPPGVLNRDDQNAPKIATQGGTERTRISSQCWKRVIRMLFKSWLKGKAAGIRTGKLLSMLEDELRLLGITNPKDIAAYKKEVQQTLLKGSKKDAPKPDAEEKKDDGEESEDMSENCVLFFSPGQVKAIANVVVDSKLKGAARGKAIKEAFQKLDDAVDVVMFGRMLASSPENSIDSATQFSQIISTHASEIEEDFFTALDEMKDRSEGEVGGGHLNSNDFSSACYYRAIVINLDMLADDAHLGKTTTLEERKQIVEFFIRACVEAFPTAKQNSFFNRTLPSYMLGVVSETYPLSLANAFSVPVKAGKEGYAKASFDALNNLWDATKKKYGKSIKPVAEVAFPDVDLDGFVAGLVKHVR